MIGREAIMPVEKRILDLILTAFGLVVLSPLFILIGALALVFHGYPILYKQQRPGYKARPFDIYKFRTMRDTRDENGCLLPDEMRLTRFGRMLRSTSLDELPELINILRSEMSLVGPRPLLMQYLERYSTEQARRHDVMPGMTGWSQINGRNRITWEEKFALDVWYVDHWSFWLDVKILFLTIFKVITREGINQAGQATAEEFMGNPK
jgi:sugar transferase EpsL